MHLQRGHRHTRLQRENRQEKNRRRDDSREREREHAERERVTERERERDRERAREREIHRMQTLPDTLRLCFSTCFFCHAVASDYAASFFQNGSFSLNCQRRSLKTEMVPQNLSHLELRNGLVLGFGLRTGCLRHGVGKLLLSFALANNLHLFFVLSQGFSQGFDVSLQGGLCEVHVLTFCFQFVFVSHVQQLSGLRFPLLQLRQSLFQLGHDLITKVIVAFLVDVSQRQGRAVDIGRKGWHSFGAKGAGASDSLQVILFCLLLLLLVLCGLLLGGQRFAASNTSSWPDKAMQLHALKKKLG